MAVDNCNVTDFDYNVFQGDVVPAGIANLTISEITGAALDFTEFSIGGAVFSQGGWIGGNVATEITKVVFTNNNDGTVNAAVYHTSFVVNNFMEIRLDIDRKPVQEHPPIAKGCTDPNAVNYNPLATSDDGSCFYPNNGGDVDANDHVSLNDGNVVFHASFELPDTKDPVAVDVSLNKGKDADCDLVLYNKTTGDYYSFTTGSFAKKYSSRSNTSDGLKNILDITEKELLEGGDFIYIPKNIYSINFPAISVNTDYSFYVIPKNNTVLADGVPSEENPYEFKRYIDTTITLALTSSSHSSNWTFAASDVTFTDRPGKKPKAYTPLVWPRDIGIEPDLKSSDMDGQPGYKYFTLTGTFDPSGGGGSKSASKSRDAYVTDISTPLASQYDEYEKDTINVRREPIVDARVSLHDLTTTFSANSLTVKGLFKVDRFGRVNESFTIAVDNFITVT
jgi:hypothetical protein